MILGLLMHPFLLGLLQKTLSIGKKTVRKSYRLDDVCYALSLLKPQWMLVWLSPTLREKKFSFLCLIPRWH